MARELPDTRFIATDGTFDVSRLIEQSLEDTREALGATAHHAPVAIEDNAPAEYEEVASPPERSSSTRRETSDKLPAVPATSTAVEFADYGEQSSVRIPFLTLIEKGRITEMQLYAYMTQTIGREMSDEEWSRFLETPQGIVFKDKVPFFQLNYRPEVSLETIRDNGDNRANSAKNGKIVMMPDELKAVIVKALRTGKELRDKELQQSLGEAPQTTTMNLPTGLPGDPGAQTLQHDIASSANAYAEQTDGTDSRRPERKRGKHKFLRTLSITAIFCAALPYGAARALVPCREGVSEIQCTVEAINVIKTIRTVSKAPGKMLDGVTSIVSAEQVPVLDDSDPTEIIVASAVNGAGSEYHG